MLQNDIIELHHGPAPWVSNVQVASKNMGQIRITIDLRNLNKYLIEYLIESIKAGLLGCKVFSKLDLRSSFSIS